MYVCVDVYVRIRVCVYGFVCMYACTNINVKYKSVHTPIAHYIQKNLVQLYMHVHVDVYVCICVCIYGSVYMYICAIT